MPVSLGNACEIISKGEHTPTPKEYVNTVNTAANGTATFYLTEDDLSTGAPIYTKVISDSIAIDVLDSTGLYSIGLPTVSADKKTVTVAITKQTFSGVTLLGVNVLGAASMIAAPSGIPIRIAVMGM